MHLTRFCASQEDVRALTGRKQASKQRQFLKERKINFRTDADGYPVVPLVELERYFGIDSLPQKRKIDVSALYEKASIQGDPKD